MWPQAFSNKTNGVTPRRWMVLSNPRLTHLITSSIGEGWIRNLEELRRMEPLADDPGFRDRWQGVKRANKAGFAEFIRHRTGIVVDPDSMFDIQVKRIHEYKRQHLNILHVIGLYHRLRSDPSLDIVPRTFVFGGKAAPGYRMAKLIIKLITAVGDIVNRDPAVRDRIKVVFLPNFNVSSGQHVYPAAELSEQISTAGTEASGTGNMKFAMNGALTIGTLDGANIEICEEVGKENFFWFGLTADQVHDLRMRGYRPRDYLAASPELYEIFELLKSGFFSRGDVTIFEPLVSSLCDYDPFCVLADYDSYAATQRTVDAAYLDRERWARMSILSSARSGKFSSDRTIAEYCKEIWRVESVPIRLLTRDQVRATFLQ
jgi:starch phosphorylase